MNRWQQRPRRVPPVAVTLLSAGLALTALAVAGLVHPGGETPSPAGVSTTTTTTVMPAPISGPPSGPAPVAVTCDDVAGRAGVPLPSGAAQDGGYAVGFPHTALGAVAVLVELDQAQIGFDYDQAALVARVYSAPGTTGLVHLAQQAVADRRRRLGVPPRGDAPAPSGFALTPYAFACHDLGADAYAVTVLSVATVTTTRGKVSEYHYRGTQLLHWTPTGGQGDWKVTTPGPTNQEQLAHLPDLPPVGPQNPRLRQVGWATIAVGAGR